MPPAAAAAVIDKQSQVIPPDDLKSAFFGAEALTDIDLTEEEIALRDGVAPAAAEGEDDTTSQEGEDDTTSQEGEDDTTSQEGEDDATSQEGEDDATSQEGEAAPAAEPAKKPPIMVPKSRLDDALKRARTAEEALKTRTPAAAEAGDFDLSTLDLDLPAADTAKMWDAALDNKPEEAHKLFAGLVKTALVGALEKVVPALQKNLQSSVAQNITQHSGAELFDQAVTTVYETYSFLDSHSADFDAGIMADAVAFQRGYEAGGDTPAVAVIKAAQAAVKPHKPELLVEDSGLKQPAKAPAASASALKRNVDAAKAQPARAPAVRSKERAPEGEIDFDSLTDAEFDALPEAVKARARGDF